MFPPPKTTTIRLNTFMAATVRLWRSEEDLGRFMPFFTMLYRCYPQKVHTCAILLHKCVEKTSQRGCSAFFPEEVV